MELSLPQFIFSKLSQYNAMNANFMYLNYGCKLSINSFLID